MSQIKEYIRRLVRDSILPGITAQGGARLDSNQGLILAEKLTAVMAEIYRQEYADRIADKCIPLATGIPETAVAVKHRKLTPTGVARRIHNWATDFTPVNLYMSEETLPVREWGDSYRYNWLELQQAAAGEISLDAEMGVIAKDAFEDLREIVAFFGDLAINIPGLLTQANIIRGVVALNAATTSTAWAAKTDVEIKTDIRRLFNLVGAATNWIMRHEPNTVLIPAAVWGTLADRVLTGTNVTLMDSLRNTYSGVEFIKAPVCDAIPAASDPTLAGTGTTRNCIVAYRRDPQHLKQIVAMQFRQLPPFWDGGQYSVKCLGRLGGTDVRFPLTVCKLEGV
jgi:hypothetical protein